MVHGTLEPVNSPETLRDGNPQGCLLRYTFLTPAKLGDLNPGAKRGANPGRKQTTPGYRRRWLPQLNGR